jgi:protein-S-isoprenylcysteine O-methyltransferase Ste14
MSPSLSVSVLVAGTVVVLAVSWRSLRRPGFHGFFRFFAFEAILGVIVLNAPVWFHRPFAPTQLLSWVLLLASLGLVIHAAYLLWHLGQPTRPRSGSPMFRIENTTLLVTSGPYRFIRHPLYASLLYLAWGASLKSLSAVSVVLAVVASAALVATAKAEEIENLGRFGVAYRSYMASTRRFIPFVL